MSTTYPIALRDGHRKATVRRVELLPNGLWRADYVGGFSTTHDVDPRPFFAAGRFAPERGR